MTAEEFRKAVLTVIISLSVGLAAMHAIGIIAGLDKIEAIVVQAEENERLIKDIREISRVIVAVTDCKPQDPGETCQEKLRKRSIAEGRERLKAVRCIVDSVNDGDPPTRTEQECIP